jgi:hypothetical protein
VSKLTTINGVFAWARRTMVTGDTENIAPRVALAMCLLERAEAEAARFTEITQTSQLLLAEAKEQLEKGE